MKITRFEEVKAWQEERKLTKMIYDAAKANKSFSRNFRFKDQITNAAISVMSNIAEGFSRHSKKEFVQFLFIAKGSIAEVQSQLYVALDQGYISDSDFKEMYLKSEDVAKILSGFITYLLNKLK